jgi:DNA repair exonuclease SbcCD nuclease subunit
MKLGYFTDTHIRADSPEGRTDNFRTSILTKLEEMGPIWKDGQVKAVLFGADLFHTPDVAKSVINDVIPIFRSWNVPIISVVGSHDYFGYQMKSLKRTALGHFVEFGMIQLVGGGLPEIPNYIYLGEGIYVTGIHHTYWFAEDPRNCYCAKVQEEGIENVYQIQLVHGDLFNVPVPWPHILTSRAETESDLVLSGHIHSGWPTKVIPHGKTKFVNPGAVARLENTGKQRIPMVNIIDVYNIKNDNNSIPQMDSKIDFIPLQSAQPHPFKEKAAEQEEVIQDTSRLIQLIASTQVDAVDIKSQLPLAARELGMSEEVLDRAFDLIEKATSK